MSPALEQGDRIIVSDLFYTPEQGDIVIISDNNILGKQLVKRVIKALRVKALIKKAFDEAFAESEDVIVGCSGFLLSRHTFVQVGYRIAFNLH